MRQFYFLAIGTSFLFLNACTASKMANYMTAHKANLQKALTLKEDPQQQLDILASSFVSVLEESLSYTSVKNSVRHVDQFSKKNKTEIDAILKNLDGWTSDMDPAQRIFLLGKLATKGYSKELFQLIPRFEKKVSRKIKTFVFLSKFLKVLDF